MAEIDTAAARRIYATAANMTHGDCHTARAVLTGMMPNILNENDRLRADNQRLRLESLTVESQTLELEQGLRAEIARLRDEVTSVLQLMDGLAEQWGDEAVFRRCRDRLRTAVESTGGGDD